MTHAAAAPSARARLGTWPYEPDVAHLVLLDHQMVPDSATVEDWVAEARDRRARVIRTGALFPPATPAFHDAGFDVVGTLSLLSLRLGDRDPRRRTGRSTRPRGVRLQRLRPAALVDAAAVDRRSFPFPWANDAAALDDIVEATPHHRARLAVVGGDVGGFAISGRAGRSGYVQRLAVDPGFRRRGIARLLLDDAVTWMQRRNVTDVLVNTASDNTPALALYRAAGFRVLPERLEILERPLRAS